MASLTKVWIARFHERGRKAPFNTEKVIARSIDVAEEMAAEWADNKYNGRCVKITVERGKGEVIADY